ncbi:MAG: signal peptidase I [Saccharospirillaceae bacterium]|nr:signal peptidase I [Pseudomonadales bacterium]NRB79077.1 signal peptidase I [Saccharospirillaceae bacterium]
MFSTFAIITIALITACFAEALFIGRRRLIVATGESSNDDLKKALHGDKITFLLHYAFIVSLVPLIIYAIKESANFELMLVIAALSGIVLAIIDKLLFKNHRTNVQVLILERKNDEYSQYADHESGIMEWGKSFYPILIIVICLRGFLFEPFQIPSGSMLPTLRVGDFLVVNKFTYGLRLPVLGTEIVDFNDPQKGDVIVFKKYRDTFEEQEPRSNGYETWIKRIIAAPGDSFMIDYENRFIYINGKRLSKIKLDTIWDQQAKFETDIFEEVINGVSHSIYNNSPKMSVAGKYFSMATNSDGAIFLSGVAEIVPEGKYFVMGDNRDGSHDGRFIGYIKEEDIVGKASFIWMHLENFKPSFTRNGSIN